LLSRFTNMLIPTVPTGPKAFRYLLIALSLAAAVPAQAQIYSWRDANGNLVLSNKRADGTVPDLPSYAVPRAQGVRTTRSAIADRARPYESLITEHSRAQGVRADLVRAVMQVESGFNPYARSPKGAMGLMQLMPETMREFHVANAFDPAENIRGGVAYLKQLLDRYSNNEVLALAAYNAGPGAVDKHGQTVPPYRETQSYVAQINKMAAKPVTIPGTTIYKAIELTPDGRPVPLYTDKKPER